MKGIIVTRDDIHEILLVMVARSLNYTVLRYLCPAGRYCVKETVFQTACSESY